MGCSGAFRVRLAFFVFAGKKTLCEWGEGSDADAVFPAGSDDLMLDIPVYHVILRLDDGQRV